MPFSEKNFFRTLAENSADVICCVGLDHVMQYASPSCTRVLGWAQDELVGTGPDFLVHADDLPSLFSNAQLTVANSQEVPPVTVRVHRKDGNLAWVEMTANLVLDPATGAPSQVVLVMRDVTSRTMREQQLELLAITDGLTGLLNRRGFDLVLDEVWRRTVQTGSQVSLLLLDIDHFKSFNDRYGHPVGDDCLRAVAAAISANLPCEADRAARYGGEELAIVLPGTGAEEAVKIAEVIRQAVLALRLPHPGVAEGNGFVSVSVGAATALARHGGSMRMPESLLLTADTALYKAKREGRNRVTPMLLVAASAQ